MGWDAYMEMDTGGAETAYVCDIGSYTFNVSPMYYKALPDGLRGLDGFRGRAAIPILRKGVIYMEQHPSELRALNPENGWGSYEGALRYLRDFLDACREHPSAWIHVT